MNIVEKIIARHAFVKAGQIGVDSVRPGDALFAVADVRFSHEYVTPMAASLFTQGLGAGAAVTEPAICFRVSRSPDISGQGHVAQASRDGLA